ncbi:MAG TPA: DUF6790 family protein [Candidatus Sulfotelmatobacter sp.]|nr:DUF6790 family protein [Candidatus Sulfotelmatobacter sp.]
MTFLGLTLIAIAVHFGLMKKPRTLRNVLEIVILYLLVFVFGLGSLLAGLMHVFNGPATAQLIGWPSGSPFQYEVGVADIAFGLVCILAFFFRGSYWLAAILANSFFLFGAFIGHVHDALASGNTAAYNIGPNIIFSDLLMPIVMILLCAIYQRLARS